METHFINLKVELSLKVVDITSSPQGDGNSLDLDGLILDELLTLHLPRKGMET